MPGDRGLDLAPARLPGRLQVLDVGRQQPAERRGPSAPQSRCSGLGGLEVRVGIRARVDALSQLAGLFPGRGDSVRGVVPDGVPTLDSVAGDLDQEERLHRIGRGADCEAPHELAASRRGWNVIVDAVARRRYFQGSDGPVIESNLGHPQALCIHRVSTGRWPRCVSPLYAFAPFESIKLGDF